MQIKNVSGLVLCLALGLSSIALVAAQTEQCNLPADYDISKITVTTPSAVEEACLTASEDLTQCTSCLCGVGVLFNSATQTPQFLSDPRITGTPAQQLSLIQGTWGTCLTSQASAFTSIDDVNLGIEVCSDPDNINSAKLAVKDLRTLVAECNKLGASLPSPAPRASTTPSPSTTTTTTPTTTTPTPSPATTTTPTTTTPTPSPATTTTTPTPSPATTTTPTTSPSGTPSPSITLPTVTVPTVTVPNVTIPTINVPTIPTINVGNVTRSLNLTGAANLASAGIQQLVLALVAALLLAQLL